MWCFFKYTYSAHVHYSTVLLQGKENKQAPDIEITRTYYRIRFSNARARETEAVPNRTLTETPQNGRWMKELVDPERLDEQSGGESNT